MCGHRNPCLVLLLLLGALLLRQIPLAAETPLSEPLSFDRLGQYGYARTFQITLADLDGDGDLDAVSANIPQQSVVWMNDGSGLFTNAYQSVGDNARGMGIGDLDGDGDPDLIFSPASSSIPTRIYWNNGSGRFSRAEEDLGDTSTPANHMSLFDIEGDGDRDAGIFYPTSLRHTRLYLNDGHGNLTSTELRLPGIAVWGDLNGDGAIDAVCVQHEQRGRGFRVFLNRGDTQLEETQHINAPSAFIAGSAALGDVDDDGDLDVIAIGSEFDRAPLTLLRNDGSGAFQTAFTTQFSCPPGRLSVGDLDGDGAIDVYVGCLEQAPLIALGDGSGGFADAGVQLGSVSLSGIAALGDLDGDGDLDIFAPSYGTDGGPNVVWINTTLGEGDDE